MKNQYPFYAGLILVLCGLLIIALTFLPVLKQEVVYQLQKPSRQVVQVAETASQAAQLKSPTDNSFKFVPTIIVPVNFDFSLVIPKIGVNASISPNINSADEKEYLPILQKGVAHAQGSSLPNQPGVVFIFAHSTDTFFHIGQYNAVFFLLNKLESADEILIFYQNKKYRYQAIVKKIVNSEEISAEIQKLTGNFLVLQTCYPPGTTLKRLLIIAQPN